MRTPLPTDTIILKCERCLTNIPLSLNGILEITRELDSSLNCIVDEKIQTEVKKHLKIGCSSPIFHPILGIPENILVSFPASKQKYVDDIKISDISYRLEMMIQQDTENKTIFALYQKNDVVEKSFLELFLSNFDTFVDVDEKEEDCCSDDVDEKEEECCSEEVHVFDDDTVHQHQQKLQRMFGGGRRIDAPYNYECLWCPREVIENGKRGRYLELKNYRDHFRKYHMTVEGGSVPMSEFLTKINRREPTWYCTNCRRRCGLASIVRHKAICQGLHFHHGNDSDDDTYFNSQDSRSERGETETNLGSDDDDGILPHTDWLPPRRLAPSSDEEEIDDRSLSDNKVRENKTAKTGPRSRSKGCVVIDPDRERRKKETANESSDIRKKAKVDERPPYMDLTDEMYTSSPEKSPENIDLTVKIEDVAEEGLDLNIEQDEYQAGPSCSTENAVDKNKWWLQIPQDDYFSVESGCPKIFGKSDSEDFVKSTTDMWRIHTQDKKKLDDTMIEAENEEAQTLQFSMTRDHPFLSDYTAFVQSFSAKDVLNIFSEDYDMMDLPTGAKATTAKQYANRIIEFFKFMSDRYKTFHLDWMTDSKGCIEKPHPDGSMSKDIFFPTVKDLQDFVKSFKYGSNPAANCGLRIFALKKMLDFLVQQIKNKEHEFQGSIIEKGQIVDCLVHKLKNMNDGICPDGTIKHIATASNKNHKRAIVEQMANCPGRNMDTIMKGVGEYVGSDEYNDQRTILIELACKKTKVPTPKEYMNSTNWLLEQLVCLGGNRPCALLGITVRDWAERQPGYCPFFQAEGNDMVQDDPDNDTRKVLKDPFKKPKGEKATEPTGFIVNSETDKISVNANQPCYIWFPNAIADLVNDHSLMAQKILPSSVDLYHPKSRIFLNSNGNAINKIECKHFKNFIGLPITSYDFRRSLSTFCLDSKIEGVKNAESAILRHREETGYAYYYQKHGEKVEYVSIQYAMKHGLVKASTQAVDEYCSSLRKGAMDEEWELTQKRTDRALEYHQEILHKRKQGLQNARRKGDRSWILPNEYQAFIEGIEEAIRMEEKRLTEEKGPGPFHNLLKYRPGEEGAGIFPPTKVWQVDMFRVLYGLTGEKGDLMRKAELSVYDGVPFAAGYTGRKKIADGMEKSVKRRVPINITEDWIVADYWRDKIRREALKIFAGKWRPLRFIFSQAEFEYNKNRMEIKIEPSLD